MSADLLKLLLTIALALRDGRIDAAEGADILDDLVDIAERAADDAIPDLIEWCGDLLHRDADELLAAAAKHEAKGHDKRAARLREKAGKR